MHLRLSACLLLILFVSGAVLAQTADDQLVAASALYDNKQFAKAADKLDAFLAAHPTHPKAVAAAWVLGRCRSDLGQYDRAIPAYRKVVASGDASLLIPAQLALGEAAIHAAKYELAAGALAAAVQTKLKPAQAVPALSWLGQANFQLKRYAPAQEAWDRLTKDYPDSDLAPDALYGAGISALRLSHTEEARTRLTRFTEKYAANTNRAPALVALAQIDIEAKRYPEARRHLEAALAPSSIETLDKSTRITAREGLIQCLLQQGDTQNALTRTEALLKELPADDPDRFTALQTLGSCRYRLNEFQGALDAYKQAATSPDAAVAADALYWSGACAAALHQYAEAATFYERMSRDYPKHKNAAKAQLHAADAYWSATKPRPAAAAYHAVTERFPGTPEAAEATKGIAELVAAVNDPDDLSAILKFATPADRAAAQFKQGKLLLAKKNYPDAERTLSAAAAVLTDPAQRAEARYQAGVAYSLDNQPLMTEPMLTGALDAQPNAEWASDAWARLLSLYANAKKPAQVERAATALLKMKPTRDQLLASRALLLSARIDQQKWEPALQAGQDLLAANPPAEEAARSLASMGWIYQQKLNKPQEALPLWMRMVKEYPQAPGADEAWLRVADARSAEADKLPDTATEARATKWAEARDDYAHLLTDFPKSDFTTEARYKLGIALFNMNKTDEAVASLDRVAADKSAGDYAEEALYWAGVALYNDWNKRKEGPDAALAQLKAREAASRLNRLVQNHPQSTHLANARKRLAVLNALTEK